MLLWIIFATLTSLAVAFTLAPLLRPRPKARTASVRDVYKAQLHEIEAQASAGLIRSWEAEAARTEIGRRLLAADAAGHVAGAPVLISGRAGRSLALALAAAVTAIALGSYLWLGSPGIPDQPFAGRASEVRAAALEQLIGQVELRVAGDPQDVQGRQILARVYIAQGRVGEAVRLYEEVLSILGESAAANVIGEAAFAHLVIDEAPTERALALIERALAKEPQNSLARHLRAETRYRAGDVAAAVTDWEALLADMGPDEPIRAMVEERLNKARSEKAAP